MAKNRTYKAFVARPSHVLNLNGELLDSAPIMAELASEVRDISAYATYVVRNDVALGKQLAAVATSVPADAGRQAGVKLPEFLNTGSGRSRIPLCLLPVHIVSQVGVVGVRRFWCCAACRCMQMTVTHGRMVVLVRRGGGLETNGRKQQWLS